MRKVILNAGIICDFKDITTKGSKNAKSSITLLIFVSFASFACFVVFCFNGESWGQTLNKEYILCVEIVGD